MIDPLDYIRDIADNMVETTLSEYVNVVSNTSHSHTSIIGPSHCFTLDGENKVVAYAAGDRRYVYKEDNMSTINRDDVRDKLIDKYFLNKGCIKSLSIMKGVVRERAYKAKEGYDRSKNEFFEGLLLGYETTLQDIENLLNGFIFGEEDD